MPRTRDYKKLAEKLQKEVDHLKKQLKVQYQKGMDCAHKEAEKLHAAFDKHMAKAVAEFHKKFKTKTKKATLKKTAKKAASKAKTAKAKTTAKRRGRPAKKKEVAKSE